MQVSLSVVSVLKAVHSHMLQNQPDLPAAENKDALNLLEYVEQAAIQWLQDKYSKTETEPQRSLMVNILFLHIKCATIVYLFLTLKFHKNLVL